jgi:thiol-disulfide isomerase/thioredoxin
MSGQRSQWTTVAGIVLAVVFTTALGLRLRPAGLTVEPGGVAPGFAAADLATGERSGLAAYRGRVVLLNVWATWCHPCRMEMPSMERLHRRFAGTDFHVVAVSVDREDARVVREFVRDMGLTFDVLHDRAGDIQRIYQTVGVPESFVIDRAGVIVKKVVGAAEWDTPATEALVRRLLHVR